jgi:type 1 glutamine amidotransferase
MNATAMMRLFACLIFCVSAISVMPAAGLGKVTKDEVAKITAAAPSKCTVQPKKPRKLLVFSRCYGFVHSSIPYGAKAVDIMGKKTGAYEAVLSNSQDMFEWENLKQFDAVFMNNCNNEIFLPENYKKLTDEAKLAADRKDARLKGNLVKFIKSGKGYAVSHAAVATFRNWPEYGNLIGGRFDNHPWTSGSTITLKLDDPNHPLCASFKGHDLKVTDEIYQIKGPYSRDKQRVLYSIDTTKTNMNKKGIHRKDGDFALGWVKSYGKGRVYYCAFGHEHELFWNPVILQQYFDGIQFVLGDLEADMTPSNKK